MGSLYANGRAANRASRRPGRSCVYRLDGFREAHRWPAERPGRLKVSCGRGPWLGRGWSGDEGGVRLGVVRAHVVCECRVCHRPELTGRKTCLSSPIRTFGGTSVVAAAERPRGPWACAPETGKAAKAVDRKSDEKVRSHGGLRESQSPASTQDGARRARDRAQKRAGGPAALNGMVVEQRRPEPVATEQESR